MELSIDLTQKKDCFRKELTHFLDRGKPMYLEYGCPRVHGMTIDEAIARLCIIDETRICMFVKSYQLDENELKLELEPSGIMKDLIGPDMEYTVAFRKVLGFAPQPGAGSYVQRILGFDLIPKQNHIEYKA